MGEKSAEVRAAEEAAAKAKSVPIASPDLDQWALEKVLDSWPEKELAAKASSVPASEKSAEVKAAEEAVAKAKSVPTSFAELDKWAEAELAARVPEEIAATETG